MFKKMYLGIQKHPVYLGLIVSIILILFGAIVNNYLKPPIYKEEKTEKTSTKSDFELQEKCAKAAQDYFEKNKRSSYSFEDYLNHYNKKLNKCFILVRGGQLGGDVISRDKYLLDVLENKVIADWGSDILKDAKVEERGQSDCQFPDRVGRCSCSESEFDSFVKPYMEE